jgi:hypothetical protein
MISSTRFKFFNYTSQRSPALVSLLPSAQDESTELLSRKTQTLGKDKSSYRVDTPSDELEDAAEDEFELFAE